jgi:hypothetical protein
LKEQFGEGDLIIKAISNNLSVTGTYHIKVHPVNDVPTAINDNLVMNEDSEISYQFFAQDPDKTELTYQIHTFPEHGLIQFDVSGTFSYVPESNYWSDFISATGK